MIKRLITTFNSLARVLKNLFLRPFRMLYSKFRYTFNAWRLVSAVPNAAKKLPKVLKTKPEKREDYFDWGSIYVAKSLVFLVTLLIIIIPLLYILLIHPLFVSWFWVKDFYTGDAALDNYSGRVRVYYDEKFTQLEFEGRLKDGKAIEHGEEFYENGRNKFVGDFLDGLYEGEGIQYYEDGAVQYRGTFSVGRYNGVGEYTSEDGETQSGTFENGKLNGRGTLTAGGSLYFDGNFKDGVKSGEGKQLYPDGKVKFSGTYTEGVLSGNALEYYADGTLKYNGAFVAGLYNGEGTLYYQSGKKQYTGSFEMGKYSGTGTLYGSNGEKQYTGDFEEGLFSGSGTLYGADGSVTTGSFAQGEIVGAAVRTFLNGNRYEGCFADSLMNGSGTLTDVTGGFSYSGLFLDDDFDYRTMIGEEPAKIKGDIPSLVQTVADDCFYLTDSGFGMAIKCSFASGGNPAAVSEIFTVPINSAETVIKSGKDISAPNAEATGKIEGAVLPTWAASEFSIPYDSVECFAAYYGDITVYYWTDKTTGKLLLKSADGTAILPDSEAGEDESLSGLTHDEIMALFEELGLDPADFSSLGFADSEGS